MQDLDRHHARQDWTSNANFPAISNELEEHFHFEEELRNDEVRPSINLLLQMLQVLLICRTVWMTRRITW